MKKTLLTAASFAFILALGATAPFGISYSDGIQVAEKFAAAASHKEMKEKGKKKMKDKMSGKEMSDMKKGKGMGKGKGAEMKDKMKGKMKK